MHIPDAQNLEHAYGTTAGKVDDAIRQLSPLVTEALALLDMPGQNGLYGPIPALLTTKNELTKDERDLAWRIDWIKNADTRPIGTDGQVEATAPSAGGPDGTFTLDAALEAAGLTPAQAQKAKEAINQGVDFDEAVEQQWTDEQVALAQLEELNEKIANWSGTDNDPILDELLKDRRDAIDTLLSSDEPIPPNTLVQLLLVLTPTQAAQAEADNPGTIDIALLDAIVKAHDENAFPDDPLNPIVESARDIRDTLVAEIAGDIDGRPDATIAAIAQQNGISYEDAELALDVNAIDLLNEQSLNIPSPQGAQVARQQRDNLILELVNGDELLAAAIGRYMSQGKGFHEANQLAVGQINQLLAQEQADEIAPQIRNLLHIDDQSGWTPWHDGDAEVTPEEASQVALLLNELDPEVASLIIASLSEEERIRLMDGLEGNATHADKPWGHWAWSPIQVPVRETMVGIDDASEAMTEYMSGITTGLAGMATNQGGPSPYNPYPPAQTEEHFRNAGTIVLEGSIPLVSNAARCADGHGLSCLALGGEILIWAAGEWIGATVVRLLGRAGSRVLARVRLPDGSEKIISVADDVPLNSSPATNAADAPRLADDLLHRQAASAFDDAGNLKPEFARNATVIIEGNKIGNPAVINTLTADGSHISDWAKFTTETIEGPHGRFQVHFYMNKLTGEINTDIDFKSVLNRRGSN